MFTKAIVRKPGMSFAMGQSSADLGKPNFELAIQQHKDYCEALLKCGLEVIELDSLDVFPDSTFVEDTAIVTNKCAIITFPGHKSRQGEEISIKNELMNHLPVEQIKEPGTVDGGDIMQIEDHFYIGLSNRTNKEGADQLKKHLNYYGFTASTIDVKGILHLKSGINYLGDGIVLIMEELKDTKELKNFKKILVNKEETYASNCVRINDSIIMPKGFHDTYKKLSALAYNIIELDMSEFEKMDGSLSCLSLRF